MTYTSVMLIVEDNRYELDKYLLLAKKAGFSGFGVSNAEDAKAFLEENRVDVLLCDIFLRDQIPVGLDLLTQALQIQGNILPIVMSSFPDEAVYKEAMDRGALHSIKKPIINADELLIAVRASREKRLMRAQALHDERRLPQKIQDLCPDGICLDDAIRKWVRIASESSELPVVIYGETGTGKEEVARLLIKYRRERHGDIPFLPVNCSLLNGDLAHSQLFGHRKGSFSGACATTEGFIGEANGGVLFLDEIHTLSLDCQQKLLRVLNDGTYHRLGDTKELRSKFQIVVASTKDLDDEVEAGRFLLDLRIRLTGCDIFLKPLRERMSDLPILLELFFWKQGIAIEECEMELLLKRCQNYYWQGNIRQLFQCLKALTALSQAEACGPRAEYLPDLRSMYAPGSKGKTP